MDNHSTTSELAQLDRTILDLLARRREVLRRAHEDEPASAPFEDPEATLRAVLDEAPAALPESFVRAVYTEILSDACAMLTPTTVAFFGSVATFTHQAALQKFGRSVPAVPQKTIGDVFDAVTRGEATFGVVPVENSTEGAVTHTLDMFLDARVSICAEIYMRIHHNLLAACPTEDIRCVYSHPQVFGQCRRWLRDNLPGIPLVEMSSTTEAVMRCREEPRAAALASELASEEYGVPIRARRVEDFQDNTTRFLVLSKAPPQAQPENDKISMLFAVRDRPGALYDCLQPLHRHKVNMTMIESRPSKRRSWEYCFFVDLLGKLTDPDLQSALDELRTHCEFVTVLGNYPQATPTE